ncbi:MAG TPA: ABC transporter permease subunit [Bacteroidetes bacterium]|nr:ABC transporter permease subunit [Bacteroidota bacterium]
MQTKHAHDKQPGKRMRMLVDTLARRVITFSGMLAIISIAGLLLSFVLEVWPLWKNPRVEITERWHPGELLSSPDNHIIAAVTEEYRQVMFLLSRNGQAFFVQTDTPDHTVLASSAFPLQEEEYFTGVEFSIDGHTALAMSNTGRIFPAVLDYNPWFDGDQRVFSPKLNLFDPIELFETEATLQAVAFSGSPEEENFVIAALTAENSVHVWKRSVESSLFGDDEITETRIVVPPTAAVATALSIEGPAQALYVGTRDGSISKFSLDVEDEAVLLQKFQAAETPITLLGFLIGERSLVVGDAAGNVSVWFEAFDPEQAGVRTMLRAHTLASHNTKVIRYSPSQRDRTFFTVSADGDLIMHFSTNERTLYRRKLEQGSPLFMRFTPKGNGALLLFPDGELVELAIDNPHPEASFKAYFGKIWYEGYSRPEYVWQSSGGSDEFEPKLGLVPLIFGTFKGTVYALLFALPVAIFAALYVSQFMHPRLRGIIKPTIELMAALPSVIIGFIGGLWLAPRIQPVIPALLLMLVLVPVSAVLLGWLLRIVPLPAFVKQRSGGMEFIIMTPVILAIAWFSFSLNDGLQSWLFAGNFQQWLVETANVTYDQRNAFVVGLVMGFAVIPIIFTISEDALSNVPATLTAGSLALGATQWQTAWKIVLPTASPGIFSAAMIGLGRAVGETMIVLMATGNTPVMDWNIFNGFRTLSANIAVEIPEAPEGGTLFRTLFLAALLLFLITFVVNTAADIIRTRMHKKYQSS